MMHLDNEKLMDQRAEEGDINGFANLWQIANASPGRQLQLGGLIRSWDNARARAAEAEAEDARWLFIPAAWTFARTVATGAMDFLAWSLPAVVAGYLIYIACMRGDIGWPW